MTHSCIFPKLRGFSFIQQFIPAAVPLHCMQESMEAHENHWASDIKCDGYLQKHLFASIIYCNVNTWSIQEALLPLKFLKRMCLWA